MQKVPAFSLLLAILVSFCCSSCYWMRMSRGGGNSAVVPEPVYKADDIVVPDGFEIGLVAKGLTFPTAAVTDDQGKLYVVEAGYSYGEAWAVPRLLRIEADGSHTVIATGTKNGPWTGVTFHKGLFYVAEGGAMEGGRILQISLKGKITYLVSNLPSMGDHHTNGPAISKDGYIYFGIGVATNSGVVGKDNASFGWLKRHPDFHDIPCADITLTGKNFDSRDVTTVDEKDQTTTGAYNAYGVLSAKGEIIKGHIPCTGSIMRIPLAGGKPELVAWGFRNPFGLAFHPNGELYLTENGYDDRGSRPIWGAADILWKVTPNTWYGWPDYSGNLPVTDREFKPPTASQPEFLLAKHPNIPPNPAASFAVHSSSDGFDFSTNPSFGYVGQAFVAQFGDMAPLVGKVLTPVGFKVVKVDITTGTIEDFAVNRDKSKGPSSLVGKGGLERPVSVKFDQNGTVLYVVDFGILNVNEKTSVPIKNTGTVWTITRKEEKQSIK